MSDVLSKTDLAVIDIVTNAMLDGNEDARLKLSARVSAVAADRWGRDIEQRPGRQQWSHFEDALADAVDDVLEHYSDDDADVEGVDGLVFEGREVDEEILTEDALRVTETIEANAEFDRNNPGGLVEQADGRAES